MVKAYILKVDRETKKISLSLKRAQPEKWDSTVDHFVIGQILIGRVTKLMAFGAFVRLDGPVEGLIHISELSNRRIQHPKDVVKEGDVVPVKLVRIEKDRHRLGLSLRQARNDAEAMGFVFSGDGAVVDYPDDVREQFGLGARDVAAEASATRAARAAVGAGGNPAGCFARPRAGIGIRGGVCAGAGERRRRDQCRARCGGGGGRGAVDEPHADAAEVAAVEAPSDENVPAVAEAVEAVDVEGTEVARQSRRSTSPRQTRPT